MLFLNVGVLYHKNMFFDFEVFIKILDIFLIAKILIFFYLLNNPNRLKKEKIRRR